MRHLFFSLCLVFCIAAHATDYVTNHNGVLSAARVSSISTYYGGANISDFYTNNGPASGVLCQGSGANINQSGMQALTTVAAQYGTFTVGGQVFNTRYSTNLSSQYDRNTYFMLGTGSSARLLFAMYVTSAGTNFSQLCSTFNAVYTPVSFSLKNPSGIAQGFSLTSASGNFYSSSVPYCSTGGLNTSLWLEPNTSLNYAGQNTTNLSASLAAPYANTNIYTTNHNGVLSGVRIASISTYYGGANISDFYTNNGPSSAALCQGNGANINQAGMQVLTTATAQYGTFYLGSQVFNTRYTTNLSSQYDTNTYFMLGTGASARLLFAMYVTSGGTNFSQLWSTFNAVYTPVSFSLKNPSGLNQGFSLTSVSGTFYSSVVNYGTIGGLNTSLWLESNTTLNFAGQSTTNLTASLVAPYANTNIYITNHNGVLSAARISSIGNYYNGAYISDFYTNNGPSPGALREGFGNITSAFANAGVIGNYSAQTGTFYIGNQVFNTRYSNPANWNSSYEINTYFILGTGNTSRLLFAMFVGSNGTGFQQLNATYNNQTSQTISFAALGNKSYGDAPFALTATASSGLPVTFTVTGPASLTGNTLTLTGGGVVTVTATQAGNFVYAAATPVIRTFSVTPQAPTFAPTFASPATALTALTNSVSLTGTGTISYSLNGGIYQTYSSPLVLPVGGTTTVQATCTISGVPSAVASATYTVPPTISIVPPTQTNPYTFLTLFGQSGATLYYSLTAPPTIENGVPTGTAYLTPVTLAAGNPTIYAAAYQNGILSAVATAYPTVTFNVNTPTYSIANNSFQLLGTNVSIATETSGATIYYTINNSGALTTGATVYTTPLTLPVGKYRIQAGAYINGVWSNDAILEVSIVGPLGAPVADPASGSGNASALTLHADQGASIYYIVGTGTVTPSNSTLWNQTVPMDILQGQTNTITAIAVRDGVVSDPLVWTYQPVFVPPFCSTCNPTGVTPSGGLQVGLTTDTNNPYLSYNSSSLAGVLNLNNWNWNGADSGLYSVSKSSNSMTVLGPTGEFVAITSNSGGWTANYYTNVTNPASLPSPYKTRTFTYDGTTATLTHEGITSQVSGTAAAGWNIQTAQKNTPTLTATINGTTTVVSQNGAVLKTYSANSVADTSGTYVTTTSSGLTTQSDGTWVYRSQTPNLRTVITPVSNESYDGINNVKETWSTAWDGTNTIRTTTYQKSVQGIVTLTQWIVETWTTTHNTTTYTSLLPNGTQNDAGNLVRTEIDYLSSDPFWSSRPQTITENGVTTDFVYQLGKQTLLVNGVSQSVPVEWTYQQQYFGANLLNSSSTETISNTNTVIASTTSDDTGALVSSTTVTSVDGMFRPLLSVDRWNRITQTQYDCCQLLSQTDPDGTVHTYGTENLSIDLGNGAGTQSYFANTESNGLQKTYSLVDALGRSLATVIQDLSTTTPIVQSVYTYDALDRIISQSKLTANTLYSWGTQYNGTTTTQTDPAGQVTTTTQDVAGRTIEQHSPNQWVQYQYGVDSVGTWTKQFLVNAGTPTLISQTWSDGLGRTVQTQTPYEIKTYQYDSNSRPIQTQGLSVTQTSYNAMNQVASTRIGVSLTPDLVHDSVVNYVRTPSYNQHVVQTTQQQPDGSFATLSTETTLSDRTQQTTVTPDGISGQQTNFSANGTETTTVITPFGSVQSIVFAQGLTDHKITSDALGNVVDTEVYSYDHFNRPTQVSNGLGTSTYTYYNDGSVATQTNALGTTSYQYAWSGDGLTTTITAPGGLVTTRVNLGNNLVSQSGNVYPITWQYDSQGHKVQQFTHPAQPNIKQWGYNGLGELITTTHADNTTTHYTYGPYGKTSETDPMGNLETITYQPTLYTATSTKGSSTLNTNTANIHTNTLTDGTTTLTTVTDLVGNVTQEQFTGGAWDGTTISNTYTNGKLSGKSLNSGLSWTYTYQPTGYLNTVTSQGSTQTYIWSLGRPMGITFTNGSNTWNVARTYNAWNAPLTLTQGSWVQTYGYDTAGRRQQITDGAWTENHQWDTFNQMSNVTTINGNINQNWNYAWDDIGRLTQSQDNANTRTWSSNARLQRTSGTGGQWIDWFNFADTGSIVLLNNTAVQQSGPLFWAQVANGTGSQYPAVTVTENGTPTYTGNVFNPTNPESITYDANGQRTSDSQWNYTWDIRGHLVQIQTTPTVVANGVPSQTIAYSYDPLGRLTSRNDGTTQTFFLWSGDTLLREEDRLGSTVTHYRNYTWSFLPNTPVGELLSVNADGVTYYPLYGGNADVVGWVDVTGASVSYTRYDPLGNVLGTYGTPPCQIGFSTQRMMDGFIWYRYRIAQNGIWLSEDPIEEGGGINLYGYCGNNAIQNWDGLGTSFSVTALKKALRLGQITQAEFEILKGSGLLQGHHIIPKELFKPGTPWAAFLLKYLVRDAEGNLIALPSKAGKEGAELLSKCPQLQERIGHWTNHPKYTEAVREKLENWHNSTKKLCDEEKLAALIKEMNKLEAGLLTTSTGRLAAVSPVIVSVYKFSSDYEEDSFQVVIGNGPISGPISETVDFVVNTLLINPRDLVYVPLDSTIDFILITQGGYNDIKHWFK